MLLSAIHTVCFILIGFMAIGYAARSKSDMAKQFDGFFAVFLQATLVVYAIAWTWS